jgi:hypothetical protein
MDSRGILEVMAKLKALLLVAAVLPLAAYVAVHAASTPGPAVAHATPGASQAVVRLPAAAAAPSTGRVVQALPVTHPSPPPLPPSRRTVPPYKGQWTGALCGGRIVPPGVVVPECAAL